MTPQQIEVLDYARELISAGAPPSIRDVTEQLSMSEAAARSAIDALIAAGALRRGPERAYNLRLADHVEVRAAPTATLVTELRRRGLDAPRSLTTRPRDDRFQPCAIHSCDKLVTTDKIMCGRHWFMLPLDLRQGLVRTSRAGETARFDGLLASARAIVGGRHGR